MIDDALYHLSRVLLLGASAQIKRRTHLEHADPHFGWGPIGAVGPDSRKTLYAAQDVHRSLIGKCDSDCDLYCPHY